MAENVGFKGYWVKDHTLFVAVRDFLPEDPLWRKDRPRLPAMVCLQEENTCTCPFNCMPKLAKRSHWFFQKYPNLEQIFLVFQRKQEKNLQRKQKEIPRYWVVWITSSFDISLQRVNYDGLQLVLRQSEPQFLTLPTSFFF